MGASSNIIKISFYLFVVYFIARGETSSNPKNADNTCTSTLTMCKVPGSYIKDNIPEIPEGPKGPQGESGLIGDRGLPGNEGLQGMQGIQGLTGRSGLPGLLVCRIQDTADDAPDLIIRHVCKKTDQKLLTKRSFRVGLLQAEVNCTNGKTCILNPQKTEIVTSSAPTWLSFVNSFNVIRYLYNATSSQIFFLQSESDTVKLKLRYHCFNSKPINNDNPEKSIRFLSWDNVVIGPEPTEDNPLHYTVTSDTCKNSDPNVWSSTDFEFETDVAIQLPVVDVYLKDVMSENSKMSIEVLELCFF